MEHSFFISDPIDLKYFYNSKFDRIYFGNEFCDELLPNRDQISNVIDFCKNYNIGFSFITPVCDNISIVKISELFKFIPKKSEVIFNDWNLLNMIVENGLIPVHGRLLLENNNNVFNIDGYFNDNSNIKIINDSFQKNLIKKNIYRVELNNEIKNYKIKFNNDIYFSIYYPYVHFKIVNNCLYRNNKVKTVNYMSNCICDRNCRKKKLKYKTGKKIFYMQGNALYYINNSIPANLEKLNINRLVYMPNFPNHNSDSNNNFYLNWDLPYKKFEDNYEWGGSDFDEKLCEIIHKIEIKDKYNILDIGCGNGRNYKIFDNLNINYYGIDTSQRAIEICNSKIKLGKFYNENILYFNKYTSYFDLIIDYGCFHTIPVFLTHKYFNSIYNLIKDSGSAIIGTWKSENSNLPFYYSYNQLPEWGYNYNSFSRMVTKHFKIIDFYERKADKDKDFIYFLIKKKAKR